MKIHFSLSVSHIETSIEGGLQELGGYQEPLFNFQLSPRPNSWRGPDQTWTETVKGPFCGTDNLGSVQLTKIRSVFALPYMCLRVSYEAIDIKNLKTTNC